MLTPAATKLYSIEDNTIEFFNDIPKTNKNKKKRQFRVSGAFFYRLNHLKVGDHPVLNLLEEILRS